MPIFEYLCGKCNEEFETLVRGEEHVECPTCHSEHLSKQYSRFGMSSTSSTQKYESLPMYKGGCGCTPSTCGCKNS